jgi:hypothetical protein
LLYNVPVDTAPQQPRKLDPRLILPLCCIDQQDYLSKAVDEAEKSPAVLEAISSTFRIELRGYTPTADYLPRALEYFTYGELPADSEAPRTIVSAIVTSPGMPTRLRYFLSSLPFRIQVKVLGQRYVVYHYPRSPTPADWINLFARVNYNIETGWHYRAISAFALSASGIALVEIGLFVFRQGSWLYGLFALPALLPLAVAPRTLLWEGSNYFEIFGRRPGELLQFGLFGFVAAPIQALKNLVEIAHPSMAGSRIDIVIETIEILACGAWLPLVLYFTTPRLLSFMPWYGVVVVWAILLGACALLARRGSRLDNEASNPLRGILDQQTTNE